VECTYPEQEKKLQCYLTAVYSLWAEPPGDLHHTPRDSRDILLWTHWPTRHDLDTPRNTNTTTGNTGTTTGNTGTAIHNTGTATGNTGTTTGNTGTTTGE